VPISRRELAPFFCRPQ